MANKVVFGLKNVHYAVMDVDQDGNVTYGTPKRIPGAVELTLEPRGDMAEFYADDMLYYSASNNQGYDGTLTVALIPDHFLVDCLGEELDAEDGILSEKSDAKGKPFALLFEFDGDEKAVRHVLYNCTASRPNIGGATRTNTVEPRTNQLVFVASPRPDNLVVKAKTTETTPPQIYDNWYAQVYEKLTGGGS